MEFRNVDKFETGENLRRLMRKAGLTTLNMQYHLRLSSPSSVYAWRQGRFLPNVENLVKISQILNCDINDIIVLEGENE